MDLDLAGFDSDTELDQSVGTTESLPSAWPKLAGNGEPHPTGNFGKSGTRNIVTM